MEAERSELLARCDTAKWWLSKLETLVKSPKRDAQSDPLGGPGQSTGVPLQGLKGSWMVEGHEAVRRSPV